MEKKIALEALVDITNNTLGYIPSTPTEFNELSLLIKKKTGRSLSLSSIKRIWGYVEYKGFPSVTTLNTLAQYNEYKDWESFVQDNTDSSDDSAFIEKSLVNTDTLEAGDRLLLGWHSGKSCEIECVSRMRFRVIRSKNIKLLPGDTFTLHAVCVSHPLYVSNIERGALYIPAYIGAKKGGIATIAIQKNKNIN